jgi:hypothetical protein
MGGSCDTVRKPARGDSEHKDPVVTTSGSIEPRTYMRVWVFICRFYPERTDPKSWPGGPVYRLEVLFSNLQSLAIVCCAFVVCLSMDPLALLNLFWVRAVDLPVKEQCQAVALPFLPRAWQLPLASPAWRHTATRRCSPQWHRPLVRPRDIACVARTSTSTKFSEHVPFQREANGNFHLVLLQG